MQKRLTFMFDLALVLGGASLLTWQFFGRDTAQNGFFLIGGASAVSIGLMRLYETFIMPSE